MHSKAICAFCSGSYHKLEAEPDLADKGIRAKTVVTGALGDTGEARVRWGEANGSPRLGHSASSFGFNWQRESRGMPVNSGKAESELSTLPKQCWGSTWNKPTSVTCPGKKQGHTPLTSGEVRRICMLGHVETTDSYRLSTHRLIGVSKCCLVPTDYNLGVRDRICVKGWPSGIRKGTCSRSASLKNNFMNEFHQLWFCENPSHFSRGSCHFPFLEATLHVGNVGSCFHVEGFLEPARNRNHVRALIKKKVFQTHMRVSQTHMWEELWRHKC